MLDQAQEKTGGDAAHDEGVSKYLSIYLNDHLAGSTVGVRLAKRIADQNDAGELGAFMAGLAREIAEDRRVLHEVMDEFDVEPDRAKVAMAWAAERAGRLKLNGHLLSYSPLSRVVELEALALCVHGTKMLWVALDGTPAVRERIGAERLEDLVARAERQLAGIEECRLEATGRAFAA